MCQQLPQSESSLQASQTTNYLFHNLFILYSFLNNNNGTGERSPNNSGVQQIQDCTQPIHSIQGKGMYVVLG